MQSNKKQVPLPKLPTGFTVTDGIAVGKRATGLLEIVFFNPKKRNASNGKSHIQMANAINSAQADPDVKVILLHGGFYFSSGNDISALAAGGSLSPEEQLR